MNYKKAMKHWKNPRKFKMTAARIRGNWGIFGKPTKYCRIIQACKWLHKEYPEISETAFYKDLSANLEGY